MKKFIYSMFALAISAMTFTSCEDVPAPYALPGNEDPVVIEPTGSGTLEDPYNVAAAFSAVANLTSHSFCITISRRLRREKSGLPGLI